MSELRGRLVKIRYCDRVKFRKDSLDKVSPALREAVGWIVHGDSCAVIVVFDRLCNFDRRALGGKPSGLCVPKNDVAEMGILEQISTFLNEKISSLEEVRQAVIKAQKVGGIKFEHPRPGQERLCSWLEAKLEEQDKGHRRDLNATVSGEEDWWGRS